MLPVVAALVGCTTSINNCEVERPLVCCAALQKTLLLAGAACHC
jgi:hypothetical protein